MVTKQNTTNVDINREYDELFELASQILNNYFNNSVNTQVTIKNTVYDLTNAKSQLDDIKEHQENFTGLFEDGNVKINSLGEYFSILKTLTTIHPRFARLPLDEGFFTINANTRTISVPSGNFVYAVKGDHMAETIYFIVDRYFDGMDLSTTNIVVQSEVGQEKNLNGVTKIDIDSKPGYMIFGWPIQDLVTKNSGTLRFAVRFYCYNGTNITYNLGTLPATINIQNTLDVDTLIGTIDNVEPYVKNYPMTGTPVINAPKFNDETTTSGGKYNLSTNPVFKLRVSDSSGTVGQKIEYNWSYCSGETGATTSPISLVDYASTIDITEENIDDIDNEEYIIYYRQVTNPEPGVPEWQKIDSFTGYVKATGTYVDGTTYYTDNTGATEIDTTDFEVGVTDVSDFYIESILYGTYKKVDSREIKPNKAGVYYGSATSYVSIYSETTEHPAYYVNAPYVLKFQRDSQNNIDIDELKYSYFTYLDEINDSIMDNYAPSGEYWAIDETASQEQYSIMNAAEAFKSVSNDDVSLILKDTSQTNIKNCHIKNEANNTSTESTDYFTVTFYPELADINISIAKNGDNYTISTSSNEALLDAGLITRTYALEGTNYSDGTSTQIATYTYDPADASTSRYKTSCTFTNSTIADNPLAFKFIITDTLSNNVSTNGAKIKTATQQYTPSTT